MAPGLTPLRLNMDETAIRFFYDQRGGFRLRPCVLRKKHGVPGYRRSSAAGRKKSMTHIAVVCDDVEVQHRLPQILLGNENNFHAAQLEHLRGLAGGRITVWRRKSAWMNKEVMKDLLVMLADCLRPWARTRQPILLLDALRSHIANDVLALASELNIWIVLVPAQATFLMRPLDTHVFGRFKHTLRRKMTRLTLTGAAHGMGLNR